MAKLLSPVTRVTCGNAIKRRENAVSACVHDMNESRLDARVTHSRPKLLRATRKLRYYICWSNARSTLFGGVSTTMVLVEELVAHGLTSM